MNRSNDRILTTHVGSLPRPQDLLPLVQARSAGETLNEADCAPRVAEAVANAVRQQIDCGIDIVSDGELGKPSFLHYVNERLAGFEPNPQPVAGPFDGTREYREFPQYYAWAARQAPSPFARALHMTCTGPISYRGHARLQADIETLRAALRGTPATEAFMPAISPSNIENWQRNAYYDSGEEFLYAIADAMHDEYQAIVDAGLVLQIDDPRLATYYNLQPNLSIEDCRNWAMTRVDALNHALRGIPLERIRYHTCYSINVGPRVHDMELKHIVDIMLRVRAGAFSFEAANPRHEHEWQLWREVRLPRDTILIPGVITHCSVIVEHPELVAERIERFANIVGRENMIAGADCGFASFAGVDEIHESIVWEKFRSLAEGARIASRRLWGRN